jgi:hypothetical protein
MKISLYLLKFYPFVTALVYLSDAQSPRYWLSNIHSHWILLAAFAVSDAYLTALSLFAFLFVVWEALLHVTVLSSWTTDLW